VECVESIKGTYVTLGNACNCTAISSGLHKGQLDKNVPIKNQVISHKISAQGPLLGQACGASAVFGRCEKHRATTFIMVAS
jgi:hypothetical protein